MRLCAVTREKGSVHHTGSPRQQRGVVRTALRTIGLCKVRTIARHGVTALTKMPLKSVACCFSKVSRLLLRTFDDFARVVSQRCRTFFDSIDSTRNTYRTVASVVCDSRITAPSGVRLVCRLCTLTDQGPLLGAMVRG